jgi:hypothetical protein
MEADLYEAFGPLVDVGEGSRMGFLNRRIAQSVMVGLSGELGWSSTWGGGTISGTGYGTSHICVRAAKQTTNPTTMVVYVGIYRKTRTLDARLYLYHYFDIVGAIFFL